MQRERVPFDWLAVGALLAATIAVRPARAPAPPPPAVVVEAAPLPAGEGAPLDPVLVADSYYRQGESARAAEVLRAAATTPDHQTLAELYEAFAAAYLIAMAPEAPVTDAFDALREAQSLDVALGGAFAAPLYDRMRAIAPRAALAFDAGGDTERAELAHHTAALFAR